MVSLRCRDDGHHRRARLFLLSQLHFRLSFGKFRETGSIDWNIGFVSAADAVGWSRAKRSPLFPLPVIESSKRTFCTTLTLCNCGTHNNDILSGSYPGNYFLLDIQVCTPRKCRKWEEFSNLWSIQIPNVAGLRELSKLWNGRISICRFRICSRTRVCLW